MICSKDPHSNRFINKKEREYLDKEIKDLDRNRTRTIAPYKSIFMSLPVWAIIITEAAENFTLYVMHNDLPKYMHLLGFNLEQNGLYSALPQVSSFCCLWIFGYISDQIINRRYLSVKNTRKIFTATGNAG
jgi:hypothetical protein